MSSRKRKQKLRHARATRARNPNPPSFAAVRGKLWRQWRPSPDETRMLAIALGIKTLVMLAMIFFSFNYAALSEVFDLRMFNDDLNAQNPLYGENQWYTDDDTTSWFLPLSYWDGQHYLLLSDYGYDHDYDRTSGQQFYPLYPMLIRALSLLMSRPMAALVLGYLLVAGFCVFLYRICEHYQCSRPSLAVLVVITFPTAFFTSAFYSEALFLFLLAGFFYHFFCTRSRAYLLFFALLPLSRGAAAFIFGGLMLWGAIEFARVAVHRLRAQSIARAEPEPEPESESEYTAPPPFVWKPYALCALVFAGGACVYLAFFHFATGDAFAGFTAQSRYPTGNSIAHLFDLPRFWDILRGGHTNNDGTWFRMHHSLFDFSALHLAIAAVLVFLVTREWMLLCLYLPLIYGYGAMGELASFSRYALTALPFLAVAVTKHTHFAWQAWIIYALCAAAFVFQMYLALRFSVSVWVG